ncbi:hypothetical protein [Frankia sp. AgB32]|uniref:hypothetical protein n=1 Tax=Frankia sp. AgB32 TaxID=631119 RepID=UPI00200C7F7E|nr:hypothetical protein [Frankia sp. AgB32]MCK9895466.1 hypothetical protein [Frankia sp. AgB32]
MTMSNLPREAVVNALAAARRVQTDVTLALEGLAAAGSGAWEGAAAEVAAGRLRRLAADAAAVLDGCVRRCAAAASALGPPVPPRAARAIGSST